MSLSAFLGFLETADGAPYVWGGRADRLWSPQGLRRHEFGVDVFDCSGLVTCALKAAGGPDWRATHAADTMFKALEPVTKPEPGDLVFYGMGGTATHVEAVMSDGRYFGAIGGSRRSVIPRPERARVRYRVVARPDAIGFRRNPLRTK